MLSVSNMLEVQAFFALEPLIAPSNVEMHGHRANNCIGQDYYNLIMKCKGTKKKIWGLQTLRSAL